MIRRCELDRTLEAIRRSGVAAELEQLLRPTGDGRPRQLGVDVFLAGLVLTAQDNRPLTLVNVHAALTSEIPRSAAIAIGTYFRSPGDTQSRPISIRQVRYLLEALERRLAYTKGRAADLEDDERPIRAALFQHVLDRIVAASLPSDQPAPSAMALDGTAIDSWARSKRPPGDQGRRKDEPAGTAAPAVPAEPEDEAAAAERRILEAAMIEGKAFDPDAGRGYRTRTWDNRTTFCFGYEMFAMVGVPDIGEDADLFPKLTHRLTVRPSGSDVVDPGLSMLDGLSADGAKIKELLNDRAWSYKAPERWADQLRERHIEQVFDLHKNDHGPRDFEGILMIDGTAHCPNTPRHLINITRPAQLSISPLKRNADAVERARHAKATKDLAEFRAKIDERQQYAFVLKAGPRPTSKDQGKLRMECPAQAGKVRCASCPMSMLLDTGLPVVQDPPPAETAPTCCTQRTVTIPGKALAKLGQREYWGSVAWIASFSRRTHVEGYFGNLKNTSTGNVKRGWCKVVGIVKTSILLACVVVATNIRLLRVWAERTGDSSDPLATPNPPNHGYEELEPETVATPATGPPTAA